MINVDNILIIFHNRTDTMRLHEYLKRLNVKSVIVPTPNQLSKSCGLSLLTKYPNINKVMFAIKYLNLSLNYSIYTEKKSFNRTNYIKMV